MTNEELDRLEALANAATPGPWVADERWVEDADEYDIGEAQETSDAEFIAAARTAIPQLIAEIRRLQAIIDPVTQGSAAIVPLELSKQNLIDAGVMDGYDSDSYLSSGCPDDDHRAWWEEAVRASRLDR